MRPICAQKDVRKKCQIILDNVITIAASENSRENIPKKFWKSQEIVFISDGINLV